jgi:hypothetical protein
MMTKTGYKTKWNWMLRDKLKKKEDKSRKR